MNRCGLSSVGVLTLLFIVAFALMSVQPIEAVPSFTRRYRLSCSTCHTVFPALNAYGRLFRAKGYRLPGARQTIPAEAPIGLGQPVETPGARTPLDIPFIDVPATSVASFQVVSDYAFRPDAGVTNEFTGITSLGLNQSRRPGNGWRVQQRTANGPRRQGIDGVPGADDILEPFAFHRKADW